MKKTIIITCIVIVLCVGLGVGGFFLYKHFKNGDKKENLPVENTVVEIDQKPLLSELRITSNGLEDFDLYFLKLNNDGKNKVYSPLSIKYALEMLSEGADGDTKEQIDAILGTYKANKYTNSKYMSFANAFFVQTGHKNNINVDYIDTLKNTYNADIVYDDFKSAKKINNWVSEKTLKLINELLNDSDVEDKIFVLINALAIDMEWVNKIQPANGDQDESGYSVVFDNEDYSFYINAYDYEYPETITFNGKEETSALIFGSVFNNYNIIEALGEDNIRNTVTEAYQKHAAEHVDDPECLIEDFDIYLNNYVKELNDNYHKGGNSTDYKYYYDKNVKVFAKDLKKYNGKQLQYVQIMPTDGKLNEYIESMDAKSLNALIKKLKDPTYKNFKEGVITEINGAVISYNYDYNMDLVSNLNELGVYKVFTQNANLSKMINEPVYVTDAFHSSTIDFSNDGIKAAAVTYVGGAGDANCDFNYNFEVPVEKIDYTFDKPFIYLIRDKSSGEIWFVGATYQQ